MDSVVLFTRFWLLLAAVGGAILPVALGNEASRKRAVVQVVCGAMMAIFLGPALERRFLPDSPAEVHAGVSFLIGCFGLRLTMIVQRLIDSRGETLANRVIDRIAGGDNP
ncbi:MAG: hypothetical protein AAGC76_19360 [Luteibacter sp.]|uniref:hypothetical protein n=1 Tax=Rhodanobacteraceae TaxID=1775411 RepID=UPI0005653F43|nr:MULTISPECIES: hypothetical protein [Rhodanobacteraceae]MDQ7998007.1 hypothetical protein [Luteibacter sp.]MDQ8050982.1 hypothetical protein [Luteibacter sp.]SDF39156.1 hypothetical protein SAMN04515659_0838 [Dyella sp. 333MFSha]SKB28027.1 hypothetical protein SAMN05660880_00318 [Luteibacter sp. 22Crub2.1]